MADEQSSFDEFMTHRAEIAQAYVSGDAAPLSAVSTVSEPATFFGPQGGIVQGAEAVRSTNEGGAGHFRPGGETRLEILHASADHDLAYWVGIQHAEVILDGEADPVPMHLRITELFRHEDGGWKLVHRHADQLAESDDS